MPPEEKKLLSCFVIMPITTPQGQPYSEDGDHFKRVLENLFVPAVRAAGFSPVPPIASGSEIIQGDIIRNLSDAELVLCDMSTLNANVFYELGIRSALNRPVVMVVDDVTEATKKVPFDLHNVGYHVYKAVPNWDLSAEKSHLKDHIVAAFEKAKGQNAVWRWFGIERSAASTPTAPITADDKLNAILSHVMALVASRAETPLSRMVPTASMMGTASMVADGSKPESLLLEVAQTVLAAFVAARTDLKSGEDLFVLLAPPQFQGGSDIGRPARSAE